MAWSAMSSEPVPFRLKKGTGTSRVGFLGGVVGHELGAGPLFQMDALRDDGGLPKTGDLPVREAGFFENPLGVLIVCGGIGEASFHRG